MLFGQDVQQLQEDVAERIAALQGMKTAIERLAEHCHGDGRPSCPILDDLSAEDPDRSHV